MTFKLLGCLSGGGTTPLVRLGVEGRQLELSWPAPLPEPVLAGDTATYPVVLPGVDLKVRAKVQGFTALVVVKDRAAAERVSRIRFDLQTDGVAMRTDPAGNSSAVDEEGRVVFHSGTPEMWDAGTGRVARPGSGPPADARRAVARVALTGTRLTVVPDHGFLADPDTT